MFLDHLDAPGICPELSPFCLSIDQHKLEQLMAKFVPITRSSSQKLPSHQRPLQSPPDETERGPCLTSLRPSLPASVSDWGAASVQATGQCVSPLWDHLWPLSLLSAPPPTWRSSHTIPSATGGSCLPVTSISLFYPPAPGRTQRTVPLTGRSRPPEEGGTRGRRQPGRAPCQGWGRERERER